MQSLLQTKTTGINCAQIGIVVKSGDTGKYPPNFLLGENCWQPLFMFGFEYFQEMPFTFKNMHVEEFNTGVAYAHG